MPTECSSSPSTSPASCESVVAVCGSIHASSTSRTLPWRPPKLPQCWPPENPPPRPPAVRGRRSKVLHPGHRDPGTSPAARRRAGGGSSHHPAARYAVVGRVGVCTACGVDRRAAGTGPQRHGHLPGPGGAAWIPARLQLGQALCGQTQGAGAEAIRCARVPAATRSSIVKRTNSSRTSQGLDNSAT